MTKIIYFTAGGIPTTGELAAIAKFNLAAKPAFEVAVRRADGVGSQLYGAGVEAADFVAGTRPTAYTSTETYPAANPDAPPFGDILAPTQAMVRNGQQIVVAGGTATITVAGGVVTAIVIA